MEPGGVSCTMTIYEYDQSSYIKIEILRGKNPQISTVLLVMFVVNSQWAVVRFLVRLIVFIVVV